MHSKLLWIRWPFFYCHPVHRFGGHNKGYIVTALEVVWSVLEATKEVIMEAINCIENSYGIC